jgi:hypothetical protein
MARAPVSKTGGWGFESLHSCQGRRPKLTPNPHDKSGMTASCARRNSSAMTAAKGLIMGLIGQSESGLA